MASEASIAKFAVIRYECTCSRLSRGGTKGRQDMPRAGDSNPPEFNGSSCSTETSVPFMRPSRAKWPQILAYSQKSRALWLNSQNLIGKVSGTLLIEPADNPRPV